MPRLLIDGRSLTKNPKGVGRYAYQLCCQIDRRLPADWMIDILVHQNDVPTFPERFRGKFVYVPVVSELKAGFNVIPKQIKKLGSQILLRPGEGIGANYGIPQIAICHDINDWITAAQESQGQRRSYFRIILDKIKNSCIKRALRASEFVLCNSSFIRAAAASYYGVADNKTKIAYCGVDERFYTLSTLVNKQSVLSQYGVNNYILCFATGDHRENFMKLPEVIASINNKQITATFIIAGVNHDAQYAHTLKRALSQLNLQLGKDYLFEGFLGGEQFNQLVELYTAADFYLELSLHEGFGMQVVEAMACGTRCISSAKGALAEVTGGYAKLIQDPTDTREITAAILSAYKEKLNSDSNFEQINFTRLFSWDSTGIAATQCLLQTATQYKLN
jgi:glycosyltransferase involved in cell wall biosynthesis